MTAKASTQKKKTVKKQTSKESKPKVAKPVGRPKKRVPNPWYPYADEEQYRVAAGLRELQLAYTCASPRTKSQIDQLFDFIGEWQDKIEDRLDEQNHPTSRKALENENKEALQKVEGATPSTGEEVEDESISEEPRNGADAESRTRQAEVQQVGA